MANPLYDTLFGRHAGKQTPFLYLSDGRVLSHDDFLRMAGRFANFLSGLGLVAGDRLAVQIAKSPEALALYAASAQTGVIFLPLNTAYTPAEVSYFVNDSGARLFICQPDQAQALGPVPQQAGAMLETLDATGGGTLCEKSAALPQTFATTPRESDDLAAFLYTSGTTGRSKGAMMTQTNLLSNAQALADLWRFSADDVLLHALPIFHTHGLFVATNISLIAGGSMIFLPGFDLDAVIGNMERATAMMGVPTFYTRLLDEPRFTRATTRSMRLFISGSAPLLSDTHIAFQDRTGHRILERYGMTETNMITSNPYGGERRAGTVGFALPQVELKITDPVSGETLPQGDIGVIEVRGPNVFKGYWQMPEKTAAELRADGFFITGDLARIDADGYVHIVGRMKDLIISGGYNIYPKEVELVLDELPGVKESAVIGVPHPDFGETVVAVVVAENGVTLGPDQIMTASGGALARFKQPRQVIVLSQLPRNTMGKVQKNVLRDTYKGLFTGAGDGG